MTPYEVGVIVAFWLATKELKAGAQRAGKKDLETLYLVMQASYENLASRLGVTLPQEGPEKETVK